MHLEKVSQHISVDETSDRFYVPPDLKNDSDDPLSYSSLSKILIDFVVDPGHFL
jgi:hypothetical protein